MPGAALYAVICLVIMLHNAATNPIGGIDFHSYWYAGHFSREGRDPYEAALLGATPTPPIQYIDGVTVNGDPAQPKLMQVPANTAPILFLLAPFSLFSWEWAKNGWMAINTLLMLAAPWLTLRLAVQHDIKLNRVAQVAVAIAFYAIASSRYTVGYGQTSIIVYVMMVLALLRVKAHQVEAGVWLGIALSKYSMAFPVLLLFAFWRQWKTVGVALWVQIVGLYAITVFGGGHAPIAILQSYIQLATRHADFSGIHLAALFGVGSIFRLIAPIAVTIAIVTVLWSRGLRLPALPVKLEAGTRQEFALIALSFVWGLLVVYHRMYDVVMILPAILLVAWWGEQVHDKSLWWMLYGLGIVTILSLPVPPYEWVFKQYWSKIFNSVWTLLLMSALVVSLVVWTKLRQQVSANDKLQLVGEGVSTSSTTK